MRVRSLVSVLVWLVVAPLAVWAALRWSPYDGLWPWVPIVAYTQNSLQETTRFAEFGPRLRP